MHIKNILKKENIDDLGKRKSPTIHLIHIPKTAGNSIWRDLINNCEYDNDKRDMILKIDTRETLDNEYSKKIYSNQFFKIKDDIHQIYEPMLPLGIMANKELNSKLKSDNFFENHKILIHHHCSGSLRFPIESRIRIGNFKFPLFFKKEINTCSHIWDHIDGPSIYTITLRDTFQRTISHLRHIYKRRIDFSNNIWPTGNAVDILPKNRRPIFQILINKLQNKEITENQAINWGLELLPELATYQLRYILTFTCSKNPKDTQNILWEISNQEVINLWKKNYPETFQFLLRRNLGAIFLNSKKEFILSKNFKNFLNLHYGVSKLNINQIWKGTVSTVINPDLVEIDNSVFKKYSLLELKYLKKLLNY